MLFAIWEFIFFKTPSITEVFRRTYVSFLKQFSSVVYFCEAQGRRLKFLNGGMLVLPQTFPRQSMKFQPTIPNSKFENSDLKHG